MNQNRQDVVDRMHAELETLVRKRTEELEQVNIRLQREIRERKQAEQALKESEYFLNAIFEHIPNMIFVKDAETLNFVRFNKAGEELLGFSRDSLIGKNDFDFFPKKEAKFFIRKDREVLENGALLDVPEEPIKTQARGKRILHTKKIPIMDKKGKPLYLLGISEDITERKHAERRILAHQDQLRALVSQLTLSEERERKRLALELHDGICQSLTFAKMKVDERLAQVSDTALQEFLTELQRALEGIMNDTRSLTNNLGSPTLQKIGLEAAIEQWLETEIMEKHAVAVRVVKGDFPKHLDSDTCALLFRAVRELSINVVKHARAKHLTVSLQTHGNELQITVVDDGKGFKQKPKTPKSFAQGGFGLFSIKERIDYMGGKLTIDSKPKRGSKVTLQVPYTQKRMTPPIEITEIKSNKSRRSKIRPAVKLQ